MNEPITPSSSHEISLKIIWSHAYLPPALDAQIPIFKLSLQLFIWKKEKASSDSCVANVHEADALRKTAAIMRVGNSQIAGYEGKNVKQLSSIYLDPGSKPWNADKGEYLIWQWRYIYLLNEE